jgi:hypothetical protein
MNKFYFHYVIKRTDEFIGIQQQLFSIRKELDKIRKRNDMHDGSTQKIDI